MALVPPSCSEFPTSGATARATHSLLPLLVSPDPYGWECAGPISNIWTSTVIDFDDVCRWQYDDQASAQLVDADRPEGWRCIGDN